MAGQRLIPNSSKELQWNKFTSILDKKTPRRRPSSSELRLLHRIFSIGAREYMLKDQKEDITRLMYFIDRTDINSMQMEPLREKAGSVSLALLTLPLDDFKQALGHLDIDFKPSIRGHLRSYGTRRINGHWERVNASHTFLMEETDDPLPKAYYGLSPGLSEMYSSLCNRYDLLISQSANFEEKLLAESFLQLIGTRILHPFWDGNGRTFIAHLTLFLEREGIRIREFEKIMDVAKALSPIQNELLARFIAHAGLEPIQGDNHFRIHLDLDFRAQYMAKLRRAVNNAINEGIGPGTLFYSDFLNARQAIADHI